MYTNFLWLVFWRTAWSWWACLSDGGAADQLRLKRTIRDLFCGEGKTVLCTSSLSFPCSSARHTGCTSEGFCLPTRIWVSVTCARCHKCRRSHECPKSSLCLISSCDFASWIKKDVKKLIVNKKIRSHEIILIVPYFIYFYNAILS